MSVDPAARADHFGNAFATPIHTDPAGPTDPSTVKLPSPYVVAVIGGSRGIGAGIALAYAKAGASGFLLTARKEASCHDTAKQILSIKPDAKIVCQGADVSSMEETKEAAEAARTAFGRLDCCVVNAGVAEAMTDYPDYEYPRWPRGFIEGAPEEWIRTFETNVKGPYFAAKYFLPLLEETSASEPDRPTNFAIISSNAAHFHESEVLPTSYSLSKLTATRMAEQINDAHSKGGKGVNAFAVHPGGVRTGMSSVVAHSVFDKYLVDDPGLCGGMLVWLTSDPSRSWLGGRFISSKWDAEKLESMKDEIVKEDKLKFRMVV